MWAPMIQVRIEPSGITLAVKPGETLLQAAKRAGLQWRSVCGGHADCRTCYFTTKEPPEVFSAPGSSEESALKTLAPVLASQGAARLACQARPLHNAVITKVGVGQRQPPSS